MWVNHCTKSKITKNKSKLRFFLGDIRDRDRIRTALDGIDIVVHAAALKQVPAAEYNPIEFIKTNVNGAQNLIEACLENDVKRLLALSTDKAAAPINLYGASKLCSDKLFIAANNIVGSRDLRFSVVRYGNVMASRGSIIPLIISQIKSGQDLTITDPSMTRFLMSLKESVSLVMHAFENGSQGDLFVQKSPASTVEDLVYALKDIFNASNKVKIIGTRHGEKLYESLVSKEEMVRAENLKNYYRIQTDNRDLNYAKYYTDGDKKIAEIEDYHSHNTTRLDRKAVMDLLIKLNYVQSQINN